MFRDLERMAIDFARELRSAAGHAEDVGEGGLGDLRDILEDALTRIKDEVFGGSPGQADARRAEEAEPAEEASPAGATDPADPAASADQPGHATK